MTDSENTTLPLGVTIQDASFRALSPVVPSEWPEGGIYHYTSSEGFRGIVESNSLRFSDPLFLNDGSEVFYANNLLLDVAKNFATGKSFRARRLIMELVERVAQTNFEYRPLVFCMSEEPNLLNQWRDYGRDIVPYCFQLDVAELLAQDWSFPCEMVKLVYEESDQRAILIALMSEIYEQVRTRSEYARSSEQWAEISNLIIAEVWAVLIRFKNPAFKGEKEWRLLAHSAYLGRQKVSFRTSRLGIVPFLSRQPRVGKLLPISCVWVGPSPWGRVSAQALDMFLRNEGYIGCPIVPSEIPAR